MSKIKYLIIIIFFQVSSAFCQENMGIANSNYSPTSSVLLNPSSIVDSKVLWEINLIGASAFLDNNYIFLPNSSARSLLFNSDNIPDALDNYNESDKYGYADIAIHGPSVSFNVGKHAFGINTQVRSVSDVRNLPADLAKFGFEGFTFLPQRGVNYHKTNIKANAMAWGEIGINYGLIFKQESNNMYMAGISLKRLFGISHVGTNINKVSYIVPDTEDIVFNGRTDAKYGFTEPAFNSGSGWSTDLGFTYKKTLKSIDNYTPYSKRNSCRKSEYKYKIGASILDLGYITNRTEAYYGEITRQPGTWQEYSNTSINSASDIDEKLRNSFARIDNSKREYTAYLPTALSLQYDYNFENGFYVNATLVQNLSFFNQLDVNRQNLLAVTPRLELPRFEVALPISLRRYQYPSVGLAFRFWNNIIIGTDRLLPLVKNQDLYGMDIYFGIKLAKLYTNKCKYKLKRLNRKNYTTNDCFY
ncbi:MAG: DUF5723 family protein [Vicingaceae bacterium]|nr:DUF5723 family protein [Vicingaceae bacterium]